MSSVSVRLESGVAEIRWTSHGTPDLAAVLRAVERAGFSATASSEEGPSPVRSAWSPFAGWRFNIAAGSFALLILAGGEWFGGWGMTPWFRWLAFGLALPVQVLCGGRFYRGAWLQLKARSSNMDTLVSLGSTAAFAYSVWGLMTGSTGHLYFMESVGIITLVSVGHGLEGYATQRASDALRGLMQLAPSTAHRRSPAGEVTEVDVNDLRAGEVVVLRPGDRIPVDGQVLEGETSVDESMLTGESTPVEKTAGAAVYAGTTVLDSQIAVRVTSSGEATALAHIVATVERAQSSRAEIQRLGDRVSSVFVPVVVLVAVLTALGWALAPEAARRVHDGLAPWLWHAAPIQGVLAAALIHAVGVLIVACPCAMGLATPAAIMSAANVGARQGILIRDGVALEKSGTIDTILFDKTGTLTEGVLQLADREIFPAPDLPAETVQRLSRALAEPSRHPLSRAICRGAAKLGEEPMGVPLPASPAAPEPSQASPQAGESDLALGLATAGGGAAGVALARWREHRGAGVEGLYPGENGAEWSRLGSFAWLEQQGVDVSAGAQFRERWTAQGATVLGMSVGQRLAAVFALRDSIRPEAVLALQTLRERGQALYLVTGDAVRTARAIAESVGLPTEHVYAEIPPERKAEVVRTLQTAGRKVAFVGDGINDAPALEQADLGIAVSQASDIARDAADLVLLRSDLRAVPEALDLARATLRIIRQNLFWAFFYNAVGIPLAALGFLSPVLCAAAMGLSDVVVIGNALRLRLRLRSTTSRPRERS